MPSNIDADGVDFSDRIDGKRKSYKASSRRRRTLDDGTEELGDLSEDDDDESLERRIARLKREVEEAKADYAKRKSPSGTEAKGSEETPTDPRLDSLSLTLEAISKPAPVFTTQTPAVVPAPSSTASKSEPLATAVPDGPTYTVTYAPTYEQTHALAKAADFDSRLLMLETALGVNSSILPEFGKANFPRAILPALDSMERQITTLSQASTANLDAISRRVRALALEQDKLNESRQKAKALEEEIGSQAPTSPPGDTEQEAKIKALYGVLPTIESLTPMLPPLLDRLRSLRRIHADAATASQTLDRVQAQQAELADELKQWRAGLEKMEINLKSGDATMEGNMKLMRDSLKGLDDRISKLS